MAFLKKHYEKVLLSIVLAGLAAAAAALPLQVSRVRQFLDETVSGVARTKPKELKPLDDYLSTNAVIVKQFEGPIDFAFSTPHNLFNPVVWKKRADNRLEKIITSTESGAGAFIVTNINELKLTIEYDRAEAISGATNQFRYHFTVTRDADANPRKSQIASLRVPNTAFTLTQVDGTPGEPTGLHLQLKDVKQEITVAKDKPFVRTTGFAADLKYPRDNKTLPFNRKRKNDVLTIPGDTEKYKIVAIDLNGVVLSAESSQKRTAIPFNAAPK